MYLKKKAAGILALLLPIKAFAGLSEADAFFEATLYERAIALYEEELRKGDIDALKPLAQSYFALGDHEKVQAVLERKQELSPEDAHLLAVAYQAQGKMSNALALLERLAPSESVTYDLGVSYYMIKQWDEAIKHLEKISYNKDNPKLYFFAQIYCIRSFIEKGLYEEAEKKLGSLEKIVPKQDEVSYQIVSLRGDVHFRKNQYALAAEYFESALPKRNKEMASWTGETLYQLGWSYLKLAETKEAGRKEAYDSAEKTFQELVKAFPQEKAYLAYARCLLSRGKDLKEESAYSKAQEILKDNGNFKSKESIGQALLMRAEATLKYEEREELYKQLTQKMEGHLPLLAESWYLRGLNEFDEGLELAGQDALAKEHFKCSGDYLDKAFTLFKNCDKQKAALSLKYLAASRFHEESKEAVEESLKHFEMLKDELYLANLTDPLEVFYFNAVAFSKLEGSEGISSAKRALEEGLEKYPFGSYVEPALFLLGRFSFQNSEFAAAEEIYAKLGLQFPKSPLAPEALYWAARSAEASHKGKESIRDYKCAVFENYPFSSWAPECYFTFFSYQEYLQGDRKAVKHLQALPIKFPDSPFILNAFYLLGMDLKRDRKTLEGKWISRKNLTSSIDAFQSVESNFEALFDKGAIPKEQLSYYIDLRYRANLERALANYAIAEEAVGAKRQIYLEYARDVFSNIVKDFGQEDNLRTVKLKQKDPIPAIEEESSFWLAKIHWLTNDEDAAEKIFSAMLAKYQSAHLTKSYFLSKLWYEKAKAAFGRGDYASALNSFKNAENAGSTILSTEETLDLWIQQSLCFQKQEFLEQSMLLLSRVINCDAASALRLKAMYLRAEIYEKQMRPKLAKRQLETVASKSGEWALKAQEKLDKDYGFD